MEDYNNLSQLNSSVKRRLNFFPGTYPIHVMRTVYVRLSFMNQRVILKRELHTFPRAMRAAHLPIKMQVNINT